MRRQWFLSRDVVERSVLPLKVGSWSSVEWMRDDKGDKDEDATGVQLRGVEGLECE